MEEKYTLYKHTGPTGKVYIGITTQNPERRWREDGSGYKNSKHLFNAIKKYGWEEFESEIIEINLSKDEAEEKEINLIKQYNSTNRELGYNIHLGGGVNGKHSNETRALMRKKSKKRPIDYEKLKKMWEINKGRTYTKEHRDNISKGLKGRTLSKEHKLAVSKANKGKVMSEETKEKIREGCIKAFADPKKRLEKSINAKNNPNIINNLKRMAKERIQVNEQIILTNTGEIYENHLSVNNYNIQANKILKNCQKEIRSAGKDSDNNPLIWRFVKDYSKDIDYQKEYKENISKSYSKAKYRAVICVTTGEYFESQKQAKEKYNIKGSGVSEVCSGKRKHAGKLKDGTKLKWKYA